MFRFSITINIMYQLKTIGSGSSGNGYIIEGDDEALIMELGCKFDDYVKALNYDTKKIMGCIVSHRHGDHIRKDTLREFLKYGIKVYANDDVRELYEGISPLETVLQIGGFMVKHFDLVHNVPNTAYVIDIANGTRLLFATDTERIPKIVLGVNVALVEANYSEEVLVDNAIDGLVNRSQYENHQSIDKCIDYLRHLDQSCLCHIVLCHLSGQNSNARAFVEKTKEMVGNGNVSVARPNMTLILESDEF